MGKARWFVTPNVCKFFVEFGYCHCHCEDIPGAIEAEYPSGSGATCGVCIGLEPEWKPDENQRQAIELIRDRLKAGEHGTRLGGLAGTGKTKLLAHLPEELGLHPDDVVYLTPTNMAADVLRGKLQAAGVDSRVFTLYRHMYESPKAKHCQQCPAHGAEGDCHGSRKLHCACDPMIWIRKQAVPFKLAIIDEASMVAYPQYVDLLDLGIPLLFVGDPGQLRPIPARGASAQERAWSVMDDLDFELTENHRVKAGSLIVKWALRVRAGKTLPFRRSKSGKVRRVQRQDPDTKQPTESAIDWSKFDWRASVILAHQRKKVAQMNRFVRSALSFRKELVVGERLVCIDNLYRDRIYNGMRGTILKATRLGDDYRVTIGLDQGREWTGTISGAQLRHIPADGAEDDRVPWARGVWRWSYAYAVTVNKAQGSEWAEVFVINDYKGEAKYRKNWFYTAITRSSSRLTIIG